MDDHRDPDGVREATRRTQDAAWSAFSLVVSGVVVWGLAGWAVSAWLDARWPLMVGLLVGMAGGLTLVWLRYGRP